MSLKEPVGSSLQGKATAVMSEMRRLLPLALLLVPQRVAAQTPDAGVFQFMQGTAEVGRESFRRSLGRFEQTTVIPLINLRLTSVALQNIQGGFAGFSLTITNAAGDSARGSYRADLVGDSVHITGRLGATPFDRTRLADFDFVMPPQSLVSFAELALRAGNRDSNYRVLVPGSPDTVRPVTVRFAGDSARLNLGSIDILVLLADQQAIAIDVPSQRLHAVRAAQPESLPPLAGLYRPPPDYSPTPGSSIRAEAVRVRGGTGDDTLSLGCTLTLPQTGPGPFPAVVTITGSGGQTRDEELWPLLPGYHPFRQLAELVGAEGIAALRCDDRGFGSSTGHPESATTADLAEDTRAQVAWLRQRSDIDPERIALAGHSEGGIIGPMLATSDRRLRALVILAGPAKPGIDVLVDQARWPVLTTPGISDSERTDRLRVAEAAVRNDSTPGNPWLRWFVRYDPRPTAGRIRQPVLILQGALDRQVSAGQADTLAGIIRSGGNRDVTVRVFPGLNHLFLPSPTDGSPSEYATLTDPAVPAAVLDTLATWLRRHLVR